MEIVLRPYSLRKYWICVWISSKRWLITRHHKTLRRSSCDRVTGDLNFPVLLRGFLLPDLQGNGDASLLILMEKIGRQTRIIPTQTAERFRLTDREQEIVKYIADGRTNKEIAHSLSISEHTVKEHVRHLLKKTKTSTRTAVLAQVYQDS